MSEPEPNLGPPAPNNAVPVASEDLRMGDVALGFAISTFLAILAVAILVDLPGHIDTEKAMLAAIAGYAAAHYLIWRYARRANRPGISVGATVTGFFGFLMITACGTFLITFGAGS